MRVRRAWSTQQSGERSLLGCAREDFGSWWGTRNLRPVELGGSKEDALSSMPPSAVCSVQLGGKTPGETKPVQEATVPVPSRQSRYVEERGLVCKILKWSDAGQRVDAPMRSTSGSMER